MKYLNKFNEDNKNDSFLKSLLLLKERIKSIELDIDKYDKETIASRLNAMYNQIERLIEDYKVTKSED